MLGKLKVNDITYSNGVLTCKIDTESKYAAKQILTDIEHSKYRGNKNFSVTIAEWKRQRSLDANAYCWVLCQKLAEKLHTTKELIYRAIVLQVGQFEIIPIKNEAVNEWIRKWNAKGLGWHSEIMEGCEREGYTNTINYFGSSVYNTKEMSILIDEIVNRCKENDIETMTPAELERLKERWGK